MKFINTFYSFFYVAFFQDVLDHKSCVQAGGCKALLKNNLDIVYVTYIAFGALDIFVPLATFKMNIWLEARALGKQGREDTSLSFLEQQAKMQAYQGDDYNADWMQIILPLYFFSMFSMVSPLLAVGLAAVQIS